MNKLISRNPILRFKEGRKIVKAYEGFKTEEGPTGNYYYTGRDGKNYVASLYGNKWVYSLDNGNFKVIGDVPKNYETTGGIKFYNDLGQALSRKAISGTPRKPWTPEQIKADRAAKGIKDTTVTVEQAEKNNKANRGKVTVDNHYIGTKGNVDLYRKSASRAKVANRNQVAALQRKLGLTADGIWGANTLAAWEKANGLAFTPSENVSLELPSVTTNNLAGVSGNTSVVQPTRVEPVIQPRNYFNYALPDFNLMAQNRLKLSGIRNYLKQGGKFKFSNKG